MQNSTTTTTSPNPATVFTAQLQKPSTLRQIKLFPSISNSKTKRGAVEVTMDHPNMSYFIHIKADETMTKCFTAITGLEETFQETASNAGSILAAWWSQVQQESSIFKLLLDRAAKSGSPLDHLTDYVVKYRSAEPQAFQSGRIKDAIAPLAFDIDKLGRKLARISQTLGNQVMSLDKAGNGLISVWEDEDGTTKGTGHSGKHTKNIVETTRPSRFRSGWLSVRKFFGRDPSSNQHEIEESHFQNSTVSATVDELLATSASISPQSFSSAEIVPNVSIPVENVSQGIPISEQPTTTTTDENLENSKIPEPQSPSVSPVSNANSKSNWLSRSSIKFELTDSDSDLCDKVDHISQSSELAIFADQFMLKTAGVETIAEQFSDNPNANIIQLGQPVLVDPLPISTDDRSRSTLFGISSPTTRQARYSLNDYLGPLKDFVSTLKTTINLATQSSRELDSSFLQVELQKSWCDRGKVMEVGDLVKFMEEACQNLSNPILYGAVYQADKEELLEKLTSLLRTSENSLKVIQDLNYLITSERKKYKELMRFCSSTSPGVGVFKNIVAEVLQDIGE